jgi:3-methylcrotonyl-CoA carboxylase alpha subunit
VFGFGDGRAVHLYERECSIQRRFQKIVEETPAPGLDPATVAAMAEAAVSLCRLERYRGAGTVEFVVDAATGAFFFLEMNTRIQVEHPVTEMTTGLDLVALQIRLARGEALSEFTQSGIRRSGHAIECRLYAENPAMNFLPSPGTLKRFRVPAADQSLRIESGVREGDAITFHYDPMIAKLVAWAESREAAIDRMRACLGDLEVEGVATNAAFLARVLAHPAFRAGDTHTGFVGAHGDALLKG